MASAAGGDRPDYGFDAPGVMAALLGGGAVAAGMGTIGALALSGWPHWFAIAVAAVGGVAALLGVLMNVYWLIGKRRTRDRILALCRLSGDERVLDVGTGAGLLLVGAAKRLTRGRAIGLDLWAEKDLSNNSRRSAERNLAVEKVAERCEIVTGDARALPFADASFDRVVSLLCLHNIEPAADRARACAEIARVLKPGGRAVIGDYVPTHPYARSLAAAGLHVVQSRAAFGTALSLMWIVVADKPDN